LSKTLSILRRIKRDVIKNLPVLQVKHLHYWQVLAKLELCPHIFENTQTANFMKIRTDVAELFRAGGSNCGQTDMTKLTVTFPQFCERAQNDENKNYFWSLYQ
jgi:hypothetical protein